MRRRGKLRVGVIVGLIIVLLAGSSASAHSGKQSYVYVSINESTFTGRVEYPAADLEAVLGITIGQDPEAALPAVIEAAAEIVAYTDDHLAIGDGTSEWPIEFSEPRVLATGFGPYILVDYTVTQEFDDVPRAFSVTFDGIFHSNPERDALLIVEHDFGSATFFNEGEHLVGFSEGLTTQDIDLDDASWFASVAAVARLGMRSIQFGLDHVLSLVLLCVLAVYPGNQATAVARSTGAILRRLRLVGAFELGALVTGAVLVVSGAEISLGLGHLAGAIGVVLLGIGVLSLVVPMGGLRTAITDRPGPIVAAVGLLQGIAMAAAFSAFLLDRSHRVSSVIGFAIGMIIAAAIVVVLTLPSLLLLRRTEVMQLAVLLGAIASIGLGAAWLAEELAGADWPIEKISNPALLWPKSLLAVAAATAAAVALFLREGGPAAALGTHSHGDHSHGDHSHDHGDHSHDDHSHDHGDHSHDDHSHDHGHDHLDHDHSHGEHSHDHGGTH